MTTKEIKLIKEQFERVNEKLKKTEAGTKEFHDLMMDYDRLYNLILAEDKAGTEAEFKEIELEMKQAELKKPITKRPEFWQTVIGAAVGCVQIFSILGYEDKGVLTSKATAFVHKMRIGK